MFSYAGHSKLGYNREENEDFVFVKEFGTKMILTIIADGNGSKPSSLQPAQIAARQISDFLFDIYDDGKNEKLLMENASLFLKEAILSVNRVLGAFRTANEEVYSGFFCSLLCAIFYTDDEGNDHMVLANVGNTRMYLIRRGNDGNVLIRQLTKDQTVAQQMLDENQIAEENYYYIAERNQLLCPLGMFNRPKIDLFDSKIKKGCLFMMTTDGIHYAIRPEALAELVLANENLEEASQTLCDSAESLKYNDDYSAILVRSI